MEAATHGPALTIERELAAPAGDVFAAFTDTSSLAQWWGPEGFTIPRLDFEPRPESAYEITMQPPEGDAFWLRGEFRVVDAPLRLAFTFAWDPPDPDDVETLVDLTFSERSGSTVVRLLQGTFKTEARRALHQAGWTESLDKLERFLARARTG